MSDPVSGSRSSRAASAFDPRALGTDACSNETAACAQSWPVATVHVADAEERVGPPMKPEPWGLHFCREADTVVEGFLCDEPVVVSDACRKPTNSFDAYVCDEPRMQSLERSVIRKTLSVLKALVLEFFGR